ncbi:hypothetical protein EEB18_001485 [Sphingopyxis sp. OPL5]|uniref:hypothetical protein n=1 Tax=Sphingopyxis sp. OPL5 TaxID=2486273 RepID=UPI00164D6B0A|nr:hypothetical protein [Sphingopyxis sp. OPL5]QNO27693.1 hypothetical protein EEB18_001485 [Sphingopyxis sp. OPL5]
MTLIGTAYLVYLPTPAFREIMAEFTEPDDFGSIYSVRQGHPDRHCVPGRAELSAAHWSMFLALLKDDFPELRQTALARGFDACWEVHSLDIQAGEDAVADAKTLPAY